MKTITVKVTEHLVIPHGVTRLPDGVLSGEHLKSLFLPETLTEIEKQPGKFFTPPICQPCSVDSGLPEAKSSHIRPADFRDANWSPDFRDVIIDVNPSQPWAVKGLMSDLFHRRWDMNFAQASARKCPAPDFCQFARECERVDSAHVFQGFAPYLSARNVECDPEYPTEPQCAGHYYEKKQYYCDTCGGFHEDYNPEQSSK